MDNERLRGSVSVLGLCSALAIAIGPACGGDEFTSDGGAGDSQAPAGGDGNSAGASDSGGSESGGSESGGTSAGGTGGATSGSGGAASGAGGSPGGSGGSGATDGGSGGSGGVGARGGTGGSPGGSGGAGGTGGASGSSGAGGSGGHSGGTGGSTGGSGGAGGIGGTGGTAGAGGTGGTGAAGGTGGTAGAGGTGATGGGGDEDCLNGVDDNGDSLVDCADPQCNAGYVCVPPAPSGWIGVGFMPSSADAGCPEGYGTEVGVYNENDLAWAPFGCDCTCGEPEGQDCFTQLRCSRNGECNDGVAGYTLVGPDCTEIQLANGTGETPIWCSATMPVPAGGECVASVEPDPTDYSWEPQALACLRADGGSCDDSQVCVPRPRDGSFYGPCIAHSGDVVCPEPFLERILGRDGSVADDRHCSDCTCGPPEGGSCVCNGSAGSDDCAVSVYPGTSCEGQSNSVRPDGSCVQTGLPLGNTDAGAILDGSYVDPLHPGSCGAGESTPGGSVTPDGTVTVCCIVN